MSECQTVLCLLGILGLGEILAVAFISYRCGVRDQKKKDEWQFGSIIR